MFILSLYVSQKTEYFCQTKTEVNYYTGWSKSLCAPDDYSTKLMIWRRLSQNIFGMWTVLYWTQFGVSLNIWRLAGDNLNITCNLLYCNYQAHRDFLITLYKEHLYALWQKLKTSYEMRDFMQREILLNIQLLIHWGRGHLNCLNCLNCLNARFRGF